jgi:small-conductance mechanosensitive channel
MDELNELLHRVLFRISETDVTPLSLLVFLTTLLIAIFAGHLGRRWVTRLLIRYSGHTHEGVAYALGRSAQYVIVGLGLVMALDNVGFSLKSLAALGAILAVGIGFGLQNIAQNFASGMRIVHSTEGWS